MMIGSVPDLFAMSLASNPWGPASLKISATDASDTILSPAEILNYESGSNPQLRSLKSSTYSAGSFEQVQTRQLEGCYQLRGCGDSEKSRREDFVAVYESFKLTLWLIGFVQGRVNLTRTCEDIIDHLDVVGDDLGKRL
jgi:hypothetical protein